MDELEQRADRAVGKAVEHLARTQAPSGSWPADYGGPMFLLPMYVALAHVTGRLPGADRRAELVRGIVSAQRPDGSIGLHQEDDRGSMFTSALNYVALRLLGMGPDERATERLRTWIHASGTPLGAASWGKFTLCLLGLYDWDGLHPILPELWLLPRGAPFHPSRLWCHARQVYLPMAWLYGMRATAPAEPLLTAIKAELYGPRLAGLDFRQHRDTVAEVDDYRPSTAALAMANRAQTGLGDVAARLLRRRALDECLEHIRYEDRVTHDIDIGPVNAVLNMFVHHFRGPAGAADLERGWSKFDRHYLWAGPSGLTMQGYNGSELWDVAFTIQAVLAAEGAGVDPALTSPVLAAASRFVRDNQILDDVPDADRHYRHPSRGGWPFSTRPHGWPITDCTAEGLTCALALAGRAGMAGVEVPTRASVELLLSWQNDDGGWATYERKRGGDWLEALNPSQVFGDIMVDYSYVECTSAVLHALSAARRHGAGSPAVDRAIERGASFLTGQQRPDGSFEGSWAVCFTYGTWFGVRGLIAAGVPVEDRRIRRAVEFLLGKQRPDGSFAEHHRSCRERRWVDAPVGHAAQTAWALLALQEGGAPADARRRAARWLLEHQSADGSWAREAMVGVFNKTCLITYDNYRNVFPAWALAAWRASPSR